MLYVLEKQIEKKNETFYILLLKLEVYPKKHTLNFFYKFAQNLLYEIQYITFEDIYTCQKKSEYKHIANIQK